MLGQVAIYTGWSTVAIFANTAALLKFYGLQDTGIGGVVWQSFILIGALANSWYFIKKFKRNPVYIITILWAFTGVFVGLTMYSKVFVLQTVTIIAILVVSSLLFYLDEWLHHKLRHLKVQH